MRYDFGNNVGRRVRDGRHWHNSLICVHGMARIPMPMWWNGRKIDIDTEESSIWPKQLYTFSNIEVYPVTILIEIDRCCCYFSTTFDLMCFFWVVFLFTVRFSLPQLDCEPKEWRCIMWNLSVLNTFSSVLFHCCFTWPLRCLMNDFPFRVSFHPSLALFINGVAVLYTAILRYTRTYTHTHTHPNTMSSNLALFAQMTMAYPLAQNGGIERVCGWRKTESFAINQRENHGTEMNLRSFAEKRRQRKENHQHYHRT